MAYVPKVCLIFQGSTLSLNVTTNHISFKEFHTRLLKINKTFIVLNLNLTTTQQDRLASFHKRTLKIIFAGSVPDPNFPSVVELKQKRACVLVGQIMDGDMCHASSDHFIRNEHGWVTRNSGFISVFISWELKCIVSSLQKLDRL